ncbi:hypothetical protein ACX3VT_07755 [Aerococcus sanguinicola]|uniref:hypothetical protein n=1 Tax=unclassified Aerococcus TaxID=2618060 RepID=UPI001438EFB9|nr:MULTISPECIES: hypothetical protein [unclassified Aerococcus]MDK6233839.1 hypothetical protein [Aerococcus sp. UMB10185]MDK6805778.1 hypothetical protein [Aerococcus sp. UMB7834]MDK6856330.1 hypothetical protein [Aerococcus sp. UMB7533]MDK8503122.1 hypothetical protein [Aerococcus sp. UMB1112A]
MTKGKVSPLAKFMMILIVLALVCIGVDLYRNADTYWEAYQAGYDSYEQSSPFD